MIYYCGWDGGASKTHVCITDENGVILAEKIFGPINISGASDETVANTIRNCMDFMKSLPYGIKNYNGLVIGVAGISNEGATQFIKETLKQEGYSGNLYLTGDNEIALSGSINGPGAVLIAGTGSICFGRDENGKTFRCGGYGYLIDDEGSGYAIGRDILIAVTKAYDGRAPETCLTEAVYNQLNVNDQKGVITWLYSPETEKKQIAALAPLLIPALNKNDNAANEIAQKAIKALTHLVTASCNKANLKNGEVALLGSIFTNYTYIKEQVINSIKSELPQIKIVIAQHSAAQGAANLARELFTV